MDSGFACAYLQWAIHFRRWLNVDVSLSSHRHVSLTRKEMDVGLRAFKIHASLSCIVKWISIYMSA
jgi:hypothetical protein